MTIRPDLMERFSHALQEAFVQRMVAHLCDDFREQRDARGIKPDDLESLVRRGIVKAEQLGVVFENDIERYLEYMVLLGLKFDRDRKLGWAREILHRGNLDGHAKMNAIGDYLIFRAEEPPL